MKMSTSKIRAKAINHLYKIAQMDTTEIKRYDEPHRFFHTWEHIEGMLDGNSEPWTNDVLFMAIIFHDIIYDPQRDDNEERSAELFLEMWNDRIKIFMTEDERTADKLFGELVVQAILETKTHKPTFPESEWLCKFDVSILQTRLPTLLKYEEQIFREFQFVAWDKYREKRIEVLKKLGQAHAGIHIPELIEIIEARRPNIGIYAGSFDPFHVGHMNILEKAEKIFDKVILARGINKEKSHECEYWEFPNKVKNREIVTYPGLLTDYLQSLPDTANYTLIRGLRNGLDLQYEMNQYRYLQDMFPKIQTVQILCDREFEHVSSSAIKHISEYDCDQQIWQRYTI